MIFLPFFLCLPLADQVVKPIHPLGHPAPERLEPCIQLIEWLGPELVDALLRDRTYVHQPGVAQHAEVLRHLGLTHPEALGDLPHWSRPVPEKLDYAQAIRFGEGCQRGVHA
jgi:hypothetical protein